MSTEEKQKRSVQNDPIKQPIDVSIDQKQVSDPQVKATRTTKRTFTTAYKLKVLTAYEACDNSLSRGELLRKEGLYSSRISTWRKQRDSGKLGEIQKNKLDKKLGKLERENNQLRKKLAQAEAVIDLQKKVSELLGNHILPAEMSEISS